MVDRALLSRAIYPDPPKCQHPATELQGHAGTSPGCNSCLNFDAIGIAPTSFRMVFCPVELPGLLQSAASMGQLNGPLSFSSCQQSLSLSHLRTWMLHRDQEQTTAARMSSMQLHVVFAAFLPEMILPPSNSSPPPLAPASPIVSHWFLLSPCQPAL